MEDTTLHMDYSLQTPEERIACVENILANTPPERLTPQYLDRMADYIVKDSMSKEQKKKKEILTNNRMVTINKREISFQGLAESLENGEDGIYGMITNDKNILFTQKLQITAEDLAEVPGLADLAAAISTVEAQAKAATGKKKFLLKQQVIQMRQQQYILKESYRQPIRFSNARSSFSRINLPETLSIDAEGNIHSNALITLLNPEHVSILLCNYSRLKESVYDALDSDAYYLMFDLEHLVDNALETRFPLYYDLLIYKIDGRQNNEIQQLLNDKYQIHYSVEYISSLWRNKIPKLIAKQAQEEYLTWYYTIVKRGKWKRCSCCGQVKLAHPLFFTRNRTSKDGFYSRCKECRNGNRT